MTDNQLPTITCPANITVNNTLGQCSATVTYTTPAGADNCPSQVTTQTAGQPSGSVFPVGTTANTFRVVDASGNSASCSFNVTVNDVQAPNAICQNITVQLNNLGNGSTNTAAINNGSSDNCGVSTLALNTTSFTCSNVGPNNVTMTVTDIHGNTSTCVSVVTVADTVRPTATCQNITVHLDANGQAVITGAMLNNGSADACGIGTLTATPSSFNCANVGSNTSTLTVTDANGNTSTCNSTVIVLDSLDPMITCPSNQVLPADSSICGAIVSWIVPQPTDNCSIDTLMGSHTSGSVFTSGTTTVSYVVQDVNGNSSTCSFTVTVNVGTLHTILTSSVLGCGYHVACAGDSTGAIDSYVTGGCLPYSYAWSNGSTAGTLSNLGAGVYTVTVTDLQGSTSTASLTITEPAPLTLAIVGDTLVCEGDSSGTLVGMVAGGQSCAAYNYLWNTGATSSALSGLPAGTYAVTVTDTMGCAVIDTAILQLGINPILELGADTAACPGNSVVFEAPPIYAAYQWNTGSQNSVITMTTPGLYICQVWTAQGCTDIDSVSLIEHVVDNDIVTPLGALNICNGDTLTLEGDAGLTNYAWSTGATTQSIFVSGAGGTFTLTALDSNGCTASESVTVNYTPFTDPHPVITPGPSVPLCDGSSLQLDVQSGYFAYEWSTGSTAQNIVVSAPGVYTCTVSNGFGCKDVSDPVNVFGVPLPSPTIVFNPPYLSTTVSYVSYQWNIGGVPIPGAIGSLYEPLAAGWYSVSVVDSNGCAGSSSDLYVNPVGIAEEVEGIEGLVLYPNPSMGVVNLRTLNPIDWPMEVDIWDMSGKKVASFQMAHLLDVMAFDLSHLSAGSYNMKIISFRRNKTQQAVLRFVME
ncbi:MAG: HYR domain-containing protein [Bacteroidia bacterium]